MQSAQHVGERRLARVEDLEQGGDPSSVIAIATAVAFSGASTSMNGAIKRRGAAIIAAADRDGEDEREAEGRPARARNRASVARAIGMADPHGRRLSEAERDHEGERGDLQRDRVRLERGACR